MKKDYEARLENQRAEKSPGVFSLDYWHWQAIIEILQNKKLILRNHFRIINCCDEIKTKGKAFTPISIKF